MSADNYLIFHKDHPVDVRGINSGAEMATLLLARFMAREGKRVVVAAQLKHGEENHQGVEYWDLGPDFNAAGALVRARELGSYHLISCGRALPLMQARLEKACLSRVLISQDRAGEDTGIKPTVLEKVVDRIVCVSEAQKKLFVEAGVRPERIAVIHNGVDQSLFTPGDPSARDYRKIVFAGALVPDKGLQVLIPAVAELRQKYPDLTLDIYGSAALWGREKFLDEQEIERQVPGIKFHGSVPHAKVAEAYRRGGIAAVPSIWFDPFPLTAVEAQVCGCPAIVFDAGGLKEGILDGETGVVVREISQEALTRALDGMLADPERLKRMSQRALATAPAHFNWAQAAQSMIAVCEAGAAGSRAGGAEIAIKQRLGVLTTWNQECGLATYAKYLFSRFPVDSYVVFGEAAPAGRACADEPFVRRCWRRAEGRYEGLYQEIKAAEIGLLHINVHQDLFVYPAFADLLSRLRADGVKVVFTVHSAFTVNPKLQALAANADCILTHTPEVRLELIANGADPAKVRVVPHGVELQPELSPSDRAALRRKLGIPEGEKAIAAFGFVQPHKGMESVIEAVVQLQAKGIPARGYIAGKPGANDPNGAAYLERLKQLAAQHGVGGRVEFMNRFLDEAEVLAYLQAADLVMMNYQANYFEASGACATALGAGALVAASIAPAFMSLGDAVWHLTSGFPAGLAAEALLANPVLSAAVREAARRYSTLNAWPNIAERVKGIYAELGFAAAAGPLRPAAPAARGRSAASQGLKVLMQNRPGTFTQRGGDTVVIEKTAAALEKRGVKVTVDVEGRAQPRDFDLVHLFNFVLPDMVRALAERAHAAGVPYVVTTLYEDVPAFHNQSHVMAACLTEYVMRGQDRAWYAAARPDLSRVEPCRGFDNRWTVEHAAALLTNGAGESAAIRRDYGAKPRVIEVMLGYDIGAWGEAEAFVREYGLRDFVLCVGRIESRKNQLMLLKALEDSDLPVVLAGGGFSYQPDYDRAVRAFRRRGKTVVLGRVSDEMLASAYRAARVHILPSWYELPGLVSLEAAGYGCRVVATRRGTTADYFGNEAFYCDPADEASVLNAVMSACHGPLKPGLKEVAMRYNWDQVGESTLQAYDCALGNKTDTRPETKTVEVQLASRPGAGAAPEIVTGGYDLAGGVTEFQEILERGELAARRKEYLLAHEWLGRALRMNPYSVRALRARGAVFFAESKPEQAREFFERGCALDPTDARVLSGLGMCEMHAKAPEKAYAYFVKALSLDGEHMVTLLQLIECAYLIGRYEDLIRILSNYVDKHPGNTEMKYCLAGAVFKQGWHERAAALCSEILQKDPRHAMAAQLQEMIAKPKAPAACAAPVLTAPPTAAPQMPSLSASTTPAVPAAPAKTATFDALDRRLVELEEEKRKKDYDAVLKGAREILNNRLARRDQVEHARLLAAEVDMFQGRLEAAGAAFEEVLRGSPACARAICGKGALAAAGQRLDEAEKLFRRANQIEPKYDVAWAGLGLCATWRGGFEDGWRCYDAALQCNPENVRALLGLIEVGYPLRRLPEVELALRNYLELHPVDLEFMYALAGCCFAQGKVEEAAAEVNKITLFAPAHSKALELKGMIDERRGSGKGAAF